MAVEKGYLSARDYAALSNDIVTDDQSLKPYQIAILSEYRSSESGIVAKELFLPFIAFGPYLGLTCLKHILEQIACNKRLPDLEIRTESYADCKEYKLTYGSDGCLYKQNKDGSFSLANTTNLNLVVSPQVQYWHNALKEYTDLHIERKNRYATLPGFSETEYDDEMRRLANVTLPIQSINEMKILTEVVQQIQTSIQTNTRKSAVKRSFSQSIASITSIDISSSPTKVRTLSWQRDRISSPEERSAKQLIF